MITDNSPCLNRERTFSRDHERCSIHRSSCDCRQFLPPTIVHSLSFLHAHRPEEFSHPHSVFTSFVPSHSCSILAMPRLSSMSAKVFHRPHLTFTRRLGGISSFLHFTKITAPPFKFRVALTSYERVIPSSRQARSLHPSRRIPYSPTDAATM